MVGLDHGPAHPTEDEDLEVSALNARYGMALFIVYSTFYAGFVLLNAFLPSTMMFRPFGGVNLAILYGLGLIAGAIVLALIYSVICRRTSAAAERGERP